MSKKVTGSKRTGLEIAVIGMNCRFPGAKSIDEFWQNLKNGRETISFFSDTELEKVGVNPELIKNPKFVKARGIIEDVEFFDSSFFGYTPIEAELMDPQIRIFYECSWEALELAGYNPDTYEGLIGINVGGTANHYWEGLSILSGKNNILGQFATDHLVDKDFLGTRLSYKLNLRGPAITLDTACSTGLVAVDIACRGLLTGQCDIALAGAISVRCIPSPGYLYEEGMIGSPDGHCRAFDEKAKGVIFSQGVGIVVLKRLEEAIADRDNIYAVIKGFAVNNDGTGKSTYTAPSIEGQSAVIRAAHHMAEVGPESISYVETHGTGTTLGDPIEFESLKLAFDSDREAFCALGSVKTNVGHLDTAAGIIGFIKAVLALKHRLIPPTLHFSKPNPKIDFENTPFYVNNVLREWKSDKYPLRAGVSSFGVGGTNAHVVLEEAPDNISEVSLSARKHKLILLSAQTASALDKAARKLWEYLNQKPDIDLADAAYTLQVGRKAFKYRKMLICSDIGEAIDLLSPDKISSGDSEGVYEFISEEDNRSVVFMFPGQGSQYINMGLDLYKSEPVFRREMDKCFSILEPITGYDLKEILYPVGCITNHERINQTEITQPVIFILEYALARLLLKWGIEPNAMIGHSIGEYVAACLSGVFSLQDALTLVVLRGKLMQKMPGGGMYSVPISEKKLKTLLEEFVIKVNGRGSSVSDIPGISIAAVNSPSLCVVSGENKVLQAFVSLLKENGYDCRRLHTSHAFHSGMMDPILEEFKEKVKQIELNKPQIPYISNVTGNWITVEDAAQPGYWAKHLRQTVRFSDGLKELLRKTDSIFIEIGPGRTLSTFVRKHTDKKPGHKIINLIRHPGEEVSDNYFLLSKIGQLWLYGKSIDWKEFYSDEKRCRILLPTYPFERQRYWIDGDPFENIGQGILSQRSLLQRKPDISNWFYIPSWKRTLLSSAKMGDTPAQFNWLLFIDDCDIGYQLSKKFKQYGHNVTIVKVGNEFTNQGNGVYTINPKKDDEYHSLLSELHAQDKIPDRIVHLWNVTKNDTLGSGMEYYEKYQDSGFYTLLYLAQAIGKQNDFGKIRIYVLTNNMQEVTGAEKLQPEKAIVLGPVQIIPREYSNVKCCSIDFILPEPGSWKRKKLIDQLAEELNTGSPDDIIALRGNHRLVQTFEPARLEQVKEKEAPSRLKERGIYLITGGLGGIGLVLAEHLAKSVKAKLILTGRSPFPSMDEWEDWLAGHDDQDAVSRKVRKLQKLEELGAEVLIIRADVSDDRQMREVISQVKSRFGGINGVIHAAGEPGAGLIQLKTREMAKKIMLPKVRGTLVLESVLKDVNLDFFILCSSVNSILPVIGQVDYCAANAFLDAFAYHKSSRDGTFTVSINWDAWQEVGMAVEASKQFLRNKGVPKFQSLKISHPLLDKYTIEREDQQIYVSNFNLGKYWVLNEHKITETGKGLVPGVTYIEMARAAFENHFGKGTIEIRDVFFLTPLIVGENEEKEVHLILKKQENNCDFLIKSKSNLKESDWQKHAVGKIVSVSAEDVVKHETGTIEERCNEGGIVIKKRKNKSPTGLLIFGPRWENTRWIKYGRNQGLAFLELPGTYSADFESYSLHPALLDSATAFLYSYIHPGSAYIPFSYKKLTIKGTITGKIFSYCRFIDDSKSEKEFLKFNITVMNEQGIELIDIEEFTMLEVTDEIKMKIKKREDYSANPHFSVDPDLSGLDTSESSTKENDFLKNGITPSEGINVFNRIVDSTLPQVIVSTTDLHNRIKVGNTVETALPGKVLNDTKAPTHSRPEISSVYVAPKTETEKLVARIWQELLGINPVGIHDDFFELGGDSLNIVQLNSKLNKALNKDINVAVMFKYLTIDSFVKYINQEETGTGASIEKEKRSDEIIKSRSRLRQRLDRK